MTDLPDLSDLSHDEKNALIRALWAQVHARTGQVQTVTSRVAALEARLVHSSRPADSPPARQDGGTRAAESGMARTLLCAACQAVLGGAVPGGTAPSAPGRGERHAPDRAAGHPPAGDREESPPDPASAARNG